MLLVAVLAPTSFAQADATYAETVGGNAHTWTNPANAGGYEGPVVQSNQTVQITCRLEGLRVADGDTWWYRIASSPWDNNYYVSADAFYNNGATSGSLSGTPFYDPAVPDCATIHGPLPSVTLAQGPAAPQGFRYAISLSGFPASSGVDVTCYDSVSPGGFYTFTVNTDGSGNATTAAYCYSGDGPDHWVTVNGVESNHATWGGAGTTLPNPAVTLTQGPTAPLGYRYAISLTGFSANSGITVKCFDSVSPGGFYSFTLGTDGSGNASTAAYCYSGDGPDHWVRANAVESNHVIWRGAAGGGKPDSGTVVKPQPSCVAPTAAPAADKYTFNALPKQQHTNAHRTRDLELETQARVGIYVKAGPVSSSMLRHFLGASASQYTVNMGNLLLDQAPLMSKLDFYLKAKATVAAGNLQATPSNSCDVTTFKTGWIGYRITDRGDLYYAIRSFSYELTGTGWIGAQKADGSRQITVTFNTFVRDTYNFNPDDATYGKFEQLAADGWAADFPVVGQWGSFTQSWQYGFDARSLYVPYPGQ